MKALYSVLYFIAAAALLIWLLLTGYDAIYDAWLFWGVIGLIVGVIVAPLTIVVMPIVLIFHGEWGMALSTYIILPILFGLYSLLEAKVSAMR